MPPGDAAATGLKAGRTGQGEEPGRVDDQWARSMAGTVESRRPGKGGAWYRRGGLRWGGMMGGNGWLGAHSGKDELILGELEASDLVGGGGYGE